ncbi:hypothetical protein [Limosilactobacillus kribbianus]|uniref:hypothetical protein n=1 Tax=Limosilactobacillus kribbianus TaxID=2982695 RepID=UPI0022652CD6|nr:hypothetical protein [Limosilactobacillus kribbianus]
MKSLISGGLFIKSSEPRVLTQAAVQVPNSNLVLTATPAKGAAALAQLAKTVSANRLVLPLLAGTPSQIQAAAERLTLLGDNVYVQVPTMSDGQLNLRLIQQLTQEGIPLALSGIATRQMVRQLLDGLNPVADMLFLMAGATSYYDLIVGSALAKLVPQIQLIATAESLNDLCMVNRLALDGVAVGDSLLPFLRRSVQGMTCQVDSQQIQLA